MHTSGVDVSPGEQGGGLKICRMPQCDKPQKNKSKWCRLHCNHLASLLHAVKVDKVNGSKEKSIAWREEMKDSNKAIAAITQHEENNAGKPKWGNSNKQYLGLTWQEESGSRLNQAEGRHVNKNGWFD